MSNSSSSNSVSLKDQFQKSKSFFSKENFLSLFDLAKEYKLITASIILLLGAGYFTFASPSQNENTAVEKQIFSVKKDDLKISISADGSISNETSLDVNFVSSGLVSEVFVMEGQEIKKGDKIASLDVRDLEFDLQMAKTNKTIASSNLEARTVGATSAEIALARQTVASASANVAETKRQNELDEKNAKLSVENQKISLNSAKTESAGGRNIDESEIKVAEVLVNTAKSELEAVKTEVINDYEKSIIDGVITISQSFPNLEQSFTEVDFILEIETNDGVIDHVGFHDSGALLRTTDYFKITKREFEVFLSEAKEFSSQYSQNTEASDSYEQEILTKLDEAISMSKKISDLIHKTTDALDNTPSITAIEKINAAKVNMVNWNTKVKAEISKLVNAKQKIIDTQIAKTSRVVTAQNKLSTAEINLEKLKVSFETGISIQDDKVLAAQKQLENTELQLENIKNKNIASVRNAESQLALANSQLRIKTEPVRPADIASLRAQITQAQNQVDEVQYKIDNSTLIAPIDGKIGVLNVLAGEYFTNDKDTSFTNILNKSRFGIQVFVEEIDITKIKMGQSVSATLDAIEGTTIKGKVTFIDNKATIDSNGIVTYLVRVSLEKTENLGLKDGMTSYVDFIIAEANKVLVIPVSAVKNINGIISVEKIQNNDSQWIKVSTGFTDGKLVEIISGLEEKEEVYFVE